LYASIYTFKEEEEEEEDDDDDDDEVLLLDAIDRSIDCLLRRKYTDPERLKPRTAACF
jgi:hypothetical protein